MPLRRALRRNLAGVDFFVYKYPNGFSFFPPHVLAALSSFSLVFYCVCRSLPIDRPPWLPGSRSHPKDSDLDPPRRRYHPLRKIHTGSFPGRLSGSITSPCSTVCLSQNEVSPPPMCSSTSLSRTAAGRRSMSPLSLEWPRSCGSSTQICLSRSAPPSSSGASGSSLVPRP